MCAYLGSHVLITADLPTAQQERLSLLNTEEQAKLGADTARYDIRLQKVDKSKKEDIILKMNSLGKYYVP